MMFTLDPIFMEGAEIILPSNFKLKEFSVGMIISNIPGKHFSVATRINKIDVSESITEPHLKVNKNIIGPLIKDDKVFLREYNPPTARQIILALSNRYYLPEGNWGNKIVNKPLLDSVLDFASNVEFMYGSEKPMFVQSTVRSTIPKAPVIVDKNTIFVVEKLDLSAISKIQDEAVNLKELRSKDYLKQMEMESFDIISHIRSNKLETNQKTFTFTQVSPKNIFSGIRQKLLNSYKFITDTSEEYEESFIGTLVAIPFLKTGQKPSLLFEFQITGKMNQGTVNLSCFSELKGKSIELFSKWEKTIKTLAQSMKEIPQAIPDNCSACGSRLDIPSQDENGIVFCNSCSTPNQLPLSLRAS